MLLDSNIVIYAAQPEHAALRELIAKHSPAVSIITLIEVLGFPRLQQDERAHLEEFSTLQRFSRSRTRSRTRPCAFASDAG